MDLGETVWRVSRMEFLTFPLKVFIHLKPGLLKQEPSEVATLLYNVGCRSLSHLCDIMKQLLSPCKVPGQSATLAVLTMVKNFSDWY